MAGEVRQMWFEPAGVHPFDGVRGAAVPPRPLGRDEAGLDRVPDQVVHEGVVAR
jgi:hypothetical protein